MVEQAARTARHDVAVEVLWPANAFCGVRWGVDQWDEAVAGTARAYDALAGGNAAVTLVSALLGDAPSSVVEFAELGAVNAWTSVGSEVLWRHGEGFTQEALDATLLRRPELTVCEHPLAVELAVTIPRPCWVGIYVSSQRGSLHHLDPRAITSLLGQVVR
ncbi:hypothetical protein [Streptomyces sp. uw30]|uniref:hypothetical protein n=1 Tax=Streptomyces sp. uw30 TaxID=1828179 RepID=UPI0011CE3FFC|nr:hypothetical protein [Streptomyces sp. uw30]